MPDAALPRPARPLTLLLLNLATSTLFLVAVIVFCVRHRLPVRDTLGLHAPTPLQALGWGALWLALMAASEIVSRHLGGPAPKPWAYPFPQLALRVFGILLLAPVAEELLFRGMLFHRLVHSPAGPVAAVLIPAALFALLHLQYSLPDMAFILVDGIFLGVVRYATGSTLLTIAMHMTGNLYAVLQRLR
jgi:membrane protease YdiL (CAAX protease family)